jgi:hypothetical protein
VKQKFVGGKGAGLEEDLLKWEEVVFSGCSRKAWPRQASRKQEHRPQKTKSEVGGTSMSHNRRSNAGKCPPATSDRERTAKIRSCGL